MPSLMKLLFGGYGSGNWEYLAQHGGTQFLKRKPAQRPFWLPLLYIAMMGIGFWYRGMGLPNVKMVTEEQLKGTVAVESEVGRYTTFTISVPADILEVPK